MKCPKCKADWFPWKPCCGEPAPKDWEPADVTRVRGMSGGKVRCADCGQLFHEIGMQGRWCEECFEIGLHKDMNDHFKNFVEQDMKEITQPTDPSKEGE